MSLNAGSASSSAFRAALLSGSAEAAEGCGGAGGAGGPPPGGFGTAGAAGVLAPPPFAPSSSSIRAIVSSFVRAGWPIGSGLTPASLAVALSLNAGSASSSALRAALPLPPPPPAAGAGGGPPGGVPPGGGLGAGGADPATGPSALSFCCLRQAISSNIDIPGGGLGTPGLFGVGGGGAAGVAAAGLGVLPPLIMRSSAECTVTGPAGCAGTLTVSQPPPPGLAPLGGATGAVGVGALAAVLGVAACCCRASPRMLAIGFTAGASPGDVAAWAGDVCLSSSSASFCTIELSVASSSLVGTWCRLCRPPSTSCNTPSAGGSPFFFRRLASRSSTAASSASRSSCSPNSVSPGSPAGSWAAEGESSDAHAAISSPPCRPRYRRSWSAAGAAAAPAAGFAAPPAFAGICLVYANTGWPASHLSALNTFSQRLHHRGSLVPPPWPMPTKSVPAIGDGALQPSSVGHRGMRATIPHR